MNYILYTAYLPNLIDENSHNQQIFSQLYYSLKSLKDVGYSGKVIVYYDSNVSFCNFDYLLNYNIFKDFDFVIFVKFKYDTFLKSTTKGAFHKWQCLKLFNRTFDYFRVLCVDNDVVFNKNPEKLFNLYANENIFYGKQYGFTEKEITNNVIYQNFSLSIPHVNTGQCIVSKKIVDKLDQNNLFIQNLVKQYFHVLSITDKYKQDESHHMLWVGEEYAITKLLNLNLINIEQFKDIDCTFGKIDKNAILNHYYSCNTKNIIPEIYWSKYTINSEFTGYRHLSEK